MPREDIPRPEYPRPDFQRKEWINLNGTWEFCTDPQGTGIEKGFWHSSRQFPETILVPFPPESRLSGIGNTDFMPSVWYRRTVSIPERWRGRRILLHFGAVDFHTTVWVNEKVLGTHTGGYTPFSFDITDALRRGRNVITVNARDDTRTGRQPRGKQSDRYGSYQCLYTRTTGIWQTVRLEAVGTPHLTGLRVIASPATGTATVLMTTSGEATLEVTAQEGDRPAAGAQTISQGCAAISLPIHCPVVWNPSRPFLYTLAISVIADGTITDRVESYFGFRDISIRGHRLFLNGNPLFMRMVLDQGYYPDGIYTAPSEESLKEDILHAQAAGFNGARLHEKVFEPLFLAWADRLGYLVWGEYGDWTTGHGVNPDTFPVVMQEWTETIDRDFNHPAIIGWCPLNETPLSQNPEIVRALHRATRTLDPTRPAHDTSGYIHVETDIYDCHSYQQDPAVFARYFTPFRMGGEPFRNYPDIEVPYTGQPYWVSEYGGIGWHAGENTPGAWGYGDRPRSKREFLDRYRALTDVLLDHPRISGFCYTQLYDVEQEVNGLYTYRRRPKFDLRVIRAINQRPAAIEAGGG